VRTLEEIFEKFVPVKERSWYPWTWPETEWFNKTGRDNPSEVRGFMSKAKDLADADFFFFSDEIMRPVGKDSIKLDPELHGEMCWLLQQPDDVVILIPRGFFKTTIANIYYTLWKFTQNTATRFLLASKTRDVSERFLHDIKTNILSNRKFQQLYPYVRPAKGRGNLRYQLWSKDKILLERPDSAKRGLSITAMGAGQTLTGMHYDTITYDDIMTPDNARTPEKRDGIRLWYNETNPLLDPNGRRVIIGTRYCDDDIYSHIEETTDIPIYVRRAIENDKYIWQEPQIIEKVKQARKELPPYIFNCQYLNNPYNEESAEFRADWIKKWCVEDVVRVKSESGSPDYFSPAMDEWYRTFDIYMGMDANRTIKKRSDKTAILVVGINLLGEKYVLDSVNRTMTTIDIEDVFVQKFFEWNKYNLVRAGIETIGGDIGIYNHVRQKIMEKNLPFHKIKPFYTERNTPKEDRIRNMQPQFYRKEIFIRNDMVELEQQLLQFPKGKYVDLIDILAYITIQLVKPKLTAIVKHEETGWRTRHRKTVPSGNWMTSG
jgi:hypothetical protein